MFNGPVPLFDALYASASNFIAGVCVCVCVYVCVCVCVCVCTDMMHVHYCY